MRIALLGAVVGALLVAVAPAAYADGIDWEVTLLPDEPGWFTSMAAAINENNVVVGSYATGGFEDLAPILWTGGTYVDIATTYGMPFAFPGGQANGLNDHGVIAGSGYAGPNWWDPAHAVLWNQAGLAMEDLHPAGYANSLALDVNNAGAAIGVVADADWYEWAYLWEADGTERILSSLPGDPYAQAFAINDAGYGAGRSLDAAYWVDRAVVWEPDGTPVDVHALLPTGTTRSFARDISENDVVVGFGANAAGESFAWTWKIGDATVTILPGPGGASGIGGSFITANFGDFAPDSLFAKIWYDGSWRVLAPPAGFGNTFLEDVNSLGFAVGSSVNEGGLGIFFDGGRAILASPTPEPGTLVLLGAAVALFLGVRRRG